MNWFESFWEGIPDNVNTSRFESALSTLCRCVQVSFSRMLKSSSSSSRKEIICTQLDRIVFKCVKSGVMSRVKEKKTLARVLAETCAFFVKHDETLIERICSLKGDATHEVEDLYERSILLGMIHRNQVINIKSIEVFASLTTELVKQDVRYVKALDTLLKDFDLVISLTSLDLLCLLRLAINGEEQDDVVLQSLFNVYLKKFVHVPLISRLATRLTCFYSKYVVVVFSILVYCSSMKREKVKYMSFEHLHKL